MNKMTLSMLFSFALIISASATADTAITPSLVQADSISHSGRTNSDGCHNDRKRGTYHCH